MNEWIKLDDRLPISVYAGLFGIRRVILLDENGRRWWAIIRWRLDEKNQKLSYKLYPLDLHESLNDYGVYEEEIKNATHWFDSSWILESLSKENWKKLTTVLFNTPNPKKCICKEVINNTRSFCD